MTPAPLVWHAVRTGESPGVWRGWGVVCLDQIYWTAILLAKQCFLFLLILLLMTQIKALLPNEWLVSSLQKKRESRASVQGGQIEFRGG